MQLVGLVLPVLLILLIRYLLHTIDLSSFRTFSKSLHVRIGIRLSISSILLSHHLNLKSAGELCLLDAQGKHIPSFREDLRSLPDSRFHITLLAAPMISLVAFTVLPFVFMVLIAFTNFDSNHQPPGELFTWTGLTNVTDIFLANQTKTTPSSASLAGRSSGRSSGSCRYSGWCCPPSGRRKAYTPPTFGPRAFFDKIPMALDEAAMLDGATRHIIFWEIILPNSKPIVANIAINAFIAPWLDFIFVSVIMKDNYNNYTVAKGLYTMVDKANIFEYYTAFCAGAVLISIPIVLVFIRLQKYYVGGVTAGSSKG